jgi:hypothetical protein
MNLIGSLLGQLINRLPPDHHLINELLERKSSNKLLDIASGIDYIRRICILDSVSATRLGVDGLDELLPEQRSIFLEKLATLCHISKVQFIFFGRDYTGIQDDIASYFGMVNNVVVHFKITGAMTVYDRRLFLQEKLHRHKNGRTFDQALRDLILDNLAPYDSTYVTDHSRVLRDSHFFPMNTDFFLRCLGFKTFWTRKPPETLLQQLNPSRLICPLSTRV